MKWWMRENQKGDKIPDWRRWRSDAVGIRKRAIGQAELVQFLTQAGFVEITFLERAGSWEPYEVIARKPG